MLLNWLLPPAAHAYMTLVGRTSRIRWEGLDHLRYLERKGLGFIYAFWHCRQALFTYTHRGEPASILVSKSADGDIIAGVMRLAGIGTFRGSSSRGSLSAAREMLSAAAAGRRLGITPDGPRGPAGSVKPGVLYLALRAGLPILPISNALGRKLVFARSWDRFQLPLPFGAACVIHGPPINVRLQDDLEAKATELKASLDRITEEAERIVAGPA